MPPKLTVPTYIDQTGKIDIGLFMSAIADINILRHDLERLTAGFREAMAQQGVIMQEQAKQIAALNKKIVAAEGGIRTILIVVGVLATIGSGIAWALTNLRIGG